VVEKKRKDIGVLTKKKEGKKMKKEKRRQTVNGRTSLRKKKAFRLNLRIQHQR
jgi:hypothetical protein